MAVFYGKNDCFGRVIQASLALGRAFGRVETTSNGGIFDSFDSIVESREDATNRTNERRNRRI